MAEKPKRLEVGKTRFANSLDTVSHNKEIGQWNPQRLQIFGQYRLHGTRDTKSK
ncbi:MAG: hypothetical protein AB7V56_04525 [Candidatus Nitrosocosmicus sp.]